MKKTKFLSLVMGVLMLGSCSLSACTNATGGASGGENPGNGTNGSGSGSLFDDPIQDTVNGNKPSEFLSTDKKITQDKTAALSYWKNQEAVALESAGIGAEDYVWTIVTLPGENMIERYVDSRTSSDIADYVTGAGKGYRDDLLKQQQVIQERIKSYDKNAEFAYSYTLASNGFAAKVKYGMLSKLREIRGIEKISVSEQYSEPTTDSTTLYSSVMQEGDFGAIAAEDNSGEARPGEGTFIAVLDTALDMSHPAFSGDCIDMNEAKVSKENIAGVLNSTDAFYWDHVYNMSSNRPIMTADDVYYNDKVVFMYDYGNKDPYVQPLSGFEYMLEHGTHTSGIAVGNDETTGFTGVAPYAQLAFMKVFYENVNDWIVYSEDVYVAAAIEDSIMLGVDAINLSLGTARGFSVDNSSQNYIYQYCYYANLIGINVQASVGNGFTSAYQGIQGDYPVAENPDYGSINSPASYSSTLAVGSYDGSNVDQYYALINEGKPNSLKVYYTDNEQYTLISKLGSGTYNWVYVTGNGSYEDFKNANADGKIAFVSINDKVDVANQMINALRANAKAVVYVDPGYYSASAVRCSVANGLPYCSMRLIEAEKMIKLGSGTMKISTSQVEYDLMSVFSAWGPTNSLTLKPEIVAIGGNVYSTLISSGRYGSAASYNDSDYGHMSGTSMAAPKATGYVARLKKALQTRYPEKSSVELTRLVNQLLMSTADPLGDLNGITYSPRYQGAGALNYTAALNTPAYISVIGSDKSKIELGEDEGRTGVYVLNFNVNNMDTKSHTYAVSVEAMTQALCADGKTVSLVSYILNNCTTSIAVSGTGSSLSGKNLTVAAGGSASVAITLRLDAAAKKYIDDNFTYGSYVEGFVSLTGTSGECQLSVPYLAFYGDWEESALLDKTEYDSEEAAVYASKLIGTYYGGYMSIELGKYPYYDFDGEYAVTVNGQDAKVSEVGYDADRLAIGSQTGGYYSLSQTYIGLLRNADQLEFSISNAETGELYEYYITDQIGKTTFLESSGSMVPVMQGISYGASMPNNTYLNFTIRAKLNKMGDTINANDSTSYIIAVDNEYPRMYSASEGVYLGDDGRVYLSIDVYENNKLSCLWLYAHEEDGTTTSLGAPIAIDTSLWVRGQKNNVTVDITDLMDRFPTNYMGVSLEDCSMNRAGYRIVIPASIQHGVTGGNGEDTNPKEVYAQSLTYDKAVNIAVGYSSDLDIVTYPADAAYTLSIVEMEDKAKYCGKAEIDEERKLVVARDTGYVRVRIESGDISVESDIYIYIIDGEWVYQLNTAGWVGRYDEELGRVVTDEQFKYDPSRPDEKYYLIYAYRGEGTHVVIPSHFVDGDGVSHEIIAIGGNAFAGCYNMLSVFIPKTIRTICYSAFYSCRQLTEIEFEKGSLLRTIDSMAFENDSSLRSIEIPAECLIISDRAFYYCTSLSSLTFEAMTAAEGSKLIWIQASAFCNTALTELNLPETLQTATSAFDGLALKKVVLPEGMTDCLMLYNCTELEEVVLPNGIKSIPQGAFQNCVSLRKITLPEGIERIGTVAFENCESLTSINIPDSVKIIDAQAFKGCIRLVSVRFGNSLTTLGKSAFEGDISLISVYFDRDTNITSWGTDVFFNCINLQQYDVHAASEHYMSDDGILYRTINPETREYELYKVPQNKSVTELLVRPDVSVIADYAFTSHYELRTVFIPASGKLREIGAYAFAACEGLTVLNLENATKLNKLGDYSFAYCVSLTSLTFPENLTQISNYAFYYNVNLETVRFADKLQSIGAYAFAYCIDYKGDDRQGVLTLPASLTSLGSSCFLYNRELRKVDMSACTQMPGSYATGYQFYNCFNLKEVVLPSSLEYISEYMFYGCTALEKINLEETKLDTIRTYAFGFCESLKEVRFPDTLKLLYLYAFCGSGLQSVDMSNTSAEMMSYVFAHCSDLKSVQFPQGSLKLDSYVFAESGLEEVYIPATCSDLNVNAFYLSPNLTRFIVDENNTKYGSTEEGILYTKSTELDENNESHTTYTMYICPLKLQAQTLVIDERFTSIPTAFFQLCTGIEKVYIPATVTYVSAGAFFYSSVKEVEFASDSTIVFTSSEYSIFEACSELKKVILPAHLDCIPSSTFSGCSSLEEITLPESVTSILPAAFYGCTSLRSIDLSGIETIGAYAFAYCSSLKELNFGSRLTSIEFGATNTAFEGCSGLEKITVNESNMAYKCIDGVLFDKTGTILYLYPAQKAGTEYAVPQGVTKINECAFAFNVHLERIIMPKTLHTIGNAAFYQVQNLHRYVFLGDKAPLLEGIYSNDAKAVLYANFYDFYFYDFGDFYCYMIVPEGATGFDSWIYQYFIYEKQSLADEPAYKLPPDYEIGEVTETKPGVEGPAPDAYSERFAQVIQSLSPGLDEMTALQLKELQKQFEADYDAFFEIIQEVPSFGENFYERYVTEANTIYRSAMELYAHRWNRIYILEEYAKQTLKSNEYSEANEKILREISYSIQTAILACNTSEDIEYYYTFYKNFIDGIPKLGTEETFYAYRREKAAWLEDSFNDIDESLYDEDVYNYFAEEFSAKTGSIASAVSYEQVNDAIRAWERMLLLSVKKADRAAFNAERDEWIDKLLSYKEEDYEYSLWLDIKAFIDRRVLLLNETFIIEDVRSYAQYGIDQVEKQESKLSALKANRITALEKAINGFAMYANLYDDEAAVLRYIVGEVEAQINAARSIEEVYSLMEDGLDRIWAYYEYNQKGYVAYRQAMQAFASLDAATYEQAISELQSISYRVPSSYSDILALIDRYCGGNAVNA